MSSKGADFGMQGLISIINDIQDVFSIIGGNEIDLPQIAVVGGQSSGKSSVLENIVGIDFLPRGNGIVTRCPLVLQLVFMKDLTTEYAIFAHKPSKQFYDFEEVRQEIESQTARETGTGVCVTDKPINLRIFSPNVVNLTLIDLPGITRNPVGDQPRNIEEILRNMIIRYIREPSCIIMAVTAANTDLALSDAIKLSKEFDPAGERTIGVITKCDIMDKGTDAGEIFDGKVIPLKLGYVGVINRSQNDINSRKDMHRQWDDEGRFFRSYYPELCSHMGTQYLRNRLNELLVSHISQSLPEIIQKVTSYRGKIAGQLAEIKSLNDGLADVNASAVQIFINYTQQLKTTIFGRGSSTTEEEELTGGARIMDIFSRDFTTDIQTIDARGCVSVREIRTAIVNNRGLHGGLFAPEQALENLIRVCLNHFEKSCFLCVEQVKNEFQSVISTILMPEFKYFPLLREVMIRETLQLLDEKTTVTKEMVHILIEMEKAYINTSHPALSPDNIKKLQGNAIATARARLLQKNNPNDPPEFQEPMVQGWMYLRRGHGKLNHVYGLLKQRSLFYNATTTLDRSDPGVQELFLEGATAAVLHNNISMGEYEFEITLANQETVMIRVDSEAVENNWIAWVNIACTEEVWRDTLTKLIASNKDETDIPVEKVEELVPDSLYNRSKIGVLQESSEWDEYNDTEQVMIEYMSRLIDTYLDTVRKNIMDNIPKCITLYLLNQTVESVYNVLITNIYNRNSVEALMKEDETMIKKREDLTRVLGLLDKSLRNLTAVKLSNTGKANSISNNPSGGVVNPWEKNTVSSVSDINWSVVKSSKSLLTKK